MKIQGQTTTPSSVSQPVVVCRDFLEHLEISSMLPFEITRDRTDQTPRGKLTPTLAGTAQQSTDNLER